ncbi:MAG: hypothetical protein Q7S42_01320 [Candidatus Omnitrophota bacterium]|nr:hypothetical protein [Candidatus Omnitrophota bacterium]
MSKGINPIRKAKLKASIIKHPENSLKAHFLEAGYSEATAGHHVGRMSVLKCVLDELKEWDIKEVTVENVLKKIRAGQELSLQKKDLSTYGFLVQLEGKYLAMFTDKQEISQPEHEDNQFSLERLSRIKATPEANKG